MSRVHVELVRWVADIRAEPRHHARQALDSMLAQLAEDLLHDPDTQARTEALKERMLEHPQVLASSISLWNALRRVLLGSLADAEGQSGCACSPRSPASPSGWIPTSSSATAWTASPRTSRCSRSTATATS